jgi:DNA-binding transcriptional MerR regulator
MPSSHTTSPCAEASAHKVAGGLLTIGALAQLSGVTVRTIRYYEEMDLISPAKRTEGRYRLYHPRSLKRITAIQALQALSFSLEDIVVMLGPSSAVALIDTKADRVKHTCQSLHKQRERVSQKLELLQGILADVDQRIADLNQHCTPCVDLQALGNCQEECEHRSIHLD